MTPGSLESASLTTWSTQLTTVESHAAVRDKFGLDLISQVADPLKNLSVRYEELRKSHVEYHGKLEKERESQLSELKKVKGKYDGVCQEVENRRKKTESSFDYHKTKAQTAYQQQLLEMSNSKVRLNRLMLFDGWLLTIAEYIYNQYSRGQQAQKSILP